MKLTTAQRETLDRAASDCGGVAGSEWYHASTLGNRRTVRALNLSGLLRIKDAVTAGGLYAITDAGRAALREGESLSNE